MTHDEIVKWMSASLERVKGSNGWPERDKLPTEDPIGDVVKVKEDDVKMTNPCAELIKNIYRSHYERPDEYYNTPNELKTCRDEYYNTPIESTFDPTRKHRECYGRGKSEAVKYYAEKHGLHVREIIPPQIDDKEAQQHQLDALRYSNASYERPDVESINDIIIKIGKTVVGSGSRHIGSYDNASVEWVNSYNTPVEFTEEQEKFHQYMKDKVLKSEGKNFDIRGQAEWKITDVAQKKSCCNNPDKYENIITSSLKFYACRSCGADLGDIT